MDRPAQGAAKEVGKRTLSFLSWFFFLNSLFFSLWQGIPCFFERFPFFSRDFRGSVGIQILVLFVIFLAFF